MNPWPTALDPQREALLLAGLLPAIPWEPERPKSDRELLEDFLAIHVGGHLNASMLRPATLPVGAPLRIEIENSPSALPGDPVGVPAMLMTIQHWLSLNITQLARVLRVERPTIYAWMAEQSSPQMANLQRVNAVYRLAMVWSRLSDDPLGAALREPVDDLSVLQLLEAEQIAVPAVRIRLEAITRCLLQKPPRPRNALDLMRERNFAATPGWMAGQALDSLSHK